MAPSRHKAVIAGLALTLTLGTAAAPAVATMSNESPTTDTDPNGMGVPLPSDYDKADFYQGGESGASFARSRTGSRLSALGLSDEMKYFAKFESSCNYNQGFSYGDGYNALGYYQFDRRYGLMDFIQQVYNSNPTKYAMFEGPLSNRSLLSDKNWKTYDYSSKQLKREAQELNEAWHAAYAADPAEFSAFQDSYAYNTYYLPVQSTLLNKFGVDVRNRADCVKGLVWGMSNLFGPTGAQNYLRDANISNDMTDRELVTALCDTVVERVTYYCSGQPQYWNGWQNRYRNEKKICLEYIAEDEAQAEASKPAPQPAPPAVMRPQVPSNPGMGGPGAGEPGAGDPLPSDPQANDKPNASGPSAGGSSTDEPGAGDAGAGNGGGATTPQDGGQAGAPQVGDGAGAGDASQGGAGGDAGAGSTDGSGASSNGGANTSAPQGDSAADGPSASGDEGNKQEAGTTGGSSDSGSSTEAGAGDESLKSEDERSDQGKQESDGNEKKTGGNAKNEPAGGQAKAGGTGAGDGSGGDGTNKGTDNAPKDKLPQTGDIGMLVMTGAAGLAVAGGSFISLGKIEGKGLEEEDEIEE